MASPYLAVPPRTLAQALRARATLLQSEAVGLNRMLARSYDTWTADRWRTVADLGRRYQRDAELCERRGPRVYRLIQSVRHLAERCEARRTPHAWSIWARARMVLDYRTDDRIHGPRGRLP